ncbi:MAG: helix-turn-helix domain-containing protein [Alphaproteobacteria bacterium]
MTLIPEHQMHEVRADSMQSVARVVARHSQQALWEIMGDTRRAPVAAARHLAWLLIRERLGYSFPRIAQFFKRDHTTVFLGVERARQRLEADAEQRAVYERCREELDSAS